MSVSLEEVVIGFETETTFLLYIYLDFFLLSFLKYQFYEDPN